MRNSTRSAWSRGRRRTEIALPRRLQLYTIPVTFDQQKQMWLNCVRFAGDSTLAEIPCGKGRIFWAAYPVELAEGSQATADLDSYVLTQTAIEPFFALQSPLSPGVLISATLDDSVLYIFSCEHASDAKINLIDKRTGAPRFQPGFPACRSRRNQPARKNRRRAP